MATLMEIKLNMLNVFVQILKTGQPIAALVLGGVKGLIGAFERAVD